MPFYTHNEETIVWKNIFNDDFSSPTIPQCSLSLSKVLITCELRSTCRAHHMHTWRIGPQECHITNTVMEGNYTLVDRKCIEGHDMEKVSKKWYGLYDNQWKAECGSFHEVEADIKLKERLRTPWYRLPNTTISNSDRNLPLMGLHREHSTPKCASCSTNSKSGITYCPQG